MRKLLSLFLSLFSLASFGQERDTAENVSLNTEIILSSRNIWRGLDYGSSPSLQGTLSITNKYFEVGTYGTTTLNGSKDGYGTWIELFATAKYNQFTLTVDDYFFFNSADSLNNYFDWGSEKTQHFIEGRLKWDTDKLDVMAGYAFYKNKSDDTNGLYLEAEYSPFNNLSFILGGLTSGSYLSFYKDGGITTVGVVGKRSIPLSKFSLLLKGSLIFNPSYENSVEAAGVGTNPVYFVVSITL